MAQIGKKTLFGMAALSAPVAGLAGYLVMNADQVDHNVGKKDVALASCISEGIIDGAQLDGPRRIKSDYDRAGNMVVTVSGTMDNQYTHGDAPFDTEIKLTVAAQRAAFSHYDMTIGKDDRTVGIKGQDPSVRNLKTSSAGKALILDNTVVANAAQKAGLCL
jgi:hypothetical protein